jgi:hypothetical protein
MVTVYITSKIWGSHGCYEEDYFLLRSDAVYSGICLRLIRVKKIKDKVLRVPGG